jgi:2',3'-cyclic-nucleotide 2'-phosphodiesterase (5'-nucleotidase family)
LAATQCKVISSNIFASTGKPFSFGATTVLAHDIFVVANEQGARMRVGVFGLTKPVRLPQFEFTYLDWLEAAATQVTALRQQVDLLIALTNQPLANDQQLVAQFPQIDLLLGGDGHQQM